jgi:DNA polymerase III subunit gamma/tau
MLIRRETNSGANDLITVYRPCAVEEVMGNAENKRILNNYLTSNTLPHVMLFSGSAGTGKTTLARVLALTLNCEDPTDKNPCLECKTCKSILNSNNMDIVEVNVGSKGGKDAVDKIVSDLAASPFQSKCKFVIFDEAHKLTPAAKDLLLKHMEDCYSHVYIVFCTNQPEKLKIVQTSNEDPFLDRCSQIKLGALTYDETLSMLENVAQFEGAQYDISVLSYISEVVKGVPRRALKALGTVLAEGSWDLATVKSLLGDTLVEEDDAEIIELSRALFKQDFKRSCIVFDKLVKKYPVESIRVAVCGYFVAILKKSGGLSLSNALTKLTVPIYTTGKPAEHIFYNVMYQVVTLLGR